MKRTCLVAAMAAALCALSVSPASANPPNDATIAGRCVAFGITDTTTNTRQIAVAAVAVAYSPTPGHNPVTLTDLKCTVRVNGSNAVTYDAVTAGPAGVLPTTVFTGAGPTDHVQVCTDWRTVDAHIQVNSGTDSCPEVPNQEAPGPIIGLVQGLVCDITRAIAPVTVSTVINIDTTGDVYLLGTKVFDC